MKLKTVTVDGTVYAVVEDGKPVYTHEDGKDVAHDAAQAIAKIRELNNEAKGHREAKEALEAQIKQFEGIDDPAAAREALEKIKNLSSGELKTAAQVEEIKAAAKKSAEDQVADVKKNLEAQIQALTAERDTLRSGWDADRIGIQFSSSKFVADKLSQPGPILQKIFGENFKVEDGKIVGYLNGQKIYGRETPGEVAGFDEALSVMVDAYPFRDSLVKGSGGGSGGGRGTGGGAADGQMPRSQFEKLSPLERAEVMRKGTTLIDG